MHQHLSMRLFPSHNHAAPFHTLRRLLTRTLVRIPNPMFPQILSRLLRVQNRVHARQEESGMVRIEQVRDLVLWPEDVAAPVEMPAQHVGRTEFPADKVSHQHLDRGRSALVDEVVADPGNPETEAYAVHRLVEDEISTGATRTRLEWKETRRTHGSTKQDLLTSFPKLLSNQAWIIVPML